MDRFAAQKGFVALVDHYFLKCSGRTKEITI